MKWASGPGHSDPRPFFHACTPDHLRDMTIMDATTPDGAAERLDAKIKEMEAAADLVIMGFYDKLAEVEALETSVTDTEVRRVIARFREIYTSLVTERSKLNGKGDGRARLGLREPIDFEAARLEIGGLLDRIRRAGVEGEVSGGADPDSA